MVLNGTALQLFHIPWNRRYNFYFFDFLSVVILLHFRMLSHHTFFKFNLTFKKKKFSPFVFTVITDILGIYFYHLILLSMDPFSCCFSVFYLYFFLFFFFRKISSTLPFNCSLKLHFCYYIIKFSKLFLCKCSIFFIL